MYKKVVKIVKYSVNCGIIPHNIKFKKGKEK